MEYLNDLGVLYSMHEHGGFCYLLGGVQRDSCVADAKAKAKAPLHRERKMIIIMRFDGASMLRLVDVF